MWGQHLQANGFAVKVNEVRDVQARQQRLGVPEALRTCHTAEVGGYIVEGHVPSREIKRLLAEKPKALGIVVPGMPGGSPGMEQGGRARPYDVLLFQKDGRTSVYASYGR